MALTIKRGIMKTFTEQYNEINADNKAQQNLLDEERLKRLKADATKYVAIPITIPVKRRSPIQTSPGPMEAILNVEQALAWVVAIPGTEGQPVETREAMGLVFNNEQAAEDLTYSLNQARTHRMQRPSVVDDLAPNPSPGLPALVRMEEEDPYYGLD